MINQLQLINIIIILDRLQRVRVGGQLSEDVGVTSGVPQ